MSSKSRETRNQRAAAALAQQRRQERRRQGLIVGGVVAVLVGIVVALFIGLSGSDTTGEEAGTVPSGVGGETGFGVVLGEDDAPLRMTIYEDFLCPACGSFEAATADLVEQGIESGDVQVEYRMVSFLDQASTDEYSSRALNAAMVVLDTAGEDAFAEFHRLLFANQPPEGGAGHSDDELVELAVQAGAEEDEVRPGIEDKVYEQWIVNATDQMSQDGVRGTPTVLVDGEEVENAEAIQLLQEAVAG